VSPTATGLLAALRHYRLAAVLWLTLLASALVTWAPLRFATEAFDTGPFRESLLTGWDTWAIRSFLTVQSRQIGQVLVALLGAVAVFALLQVFVTGGLLRVLIAGARRPVLGEVVTQSAALFRANLWATVRFMLTSALWISVLVALPCAGLHKLAKDAPPNAGVATTIHLWALVGSLIVLFNTSLRFDLARIALARGDARNARGAYRIAKESLSGRRTSTIGLVLFWLLVAVAVQALFTSLGLRMNPHSSGGIAWLFAVRQAGFFALAMARVGFFASLIAWDRRRTSYSAIGSASGGITWKAQAPISTSAPASAFPETGSSVITNGSAFLSS
jgi:hypothetical protein